MAETIQGETAPRFSAVRAEFQRNFAQRDEVGAACAVYHRGEKVVDLWGGYRDRKQRLPWEKDTMTLVFSTTKGVAGLAVAMAHSMGFIDFEAPVDRYW